MTRIQTSSSRLQDLEECEVLPPPDLEGKRFEYEGEEYAILEFPLLRGEALDGLSPAERDIVAQLLAGHTVPEVARRRQRSPYTVANQVRCIYAKLGIHSREELVAAAAARR
jgi:DNA-binding CsgD family transcriptional regulator